LVKCGISSSCRRHDIIDLQKREGRFRARHSGERIGMSTTGDGVYYDPYDFEIDSDPYPVWKRLRDEAPLYYNERYDFYALSRFDDVERASVDWKTYSSAKGTILELIKSNFGMPPGSIIFEDPPTHDLHRALLARVFTPRKVSALEPKIREFCARSLDPLVGAGGFDFIRDLGAQMPMRTIGMLLGIPEDDQEAIRDQIDAGLRLSQSEMPDLDARHEALNTTDDPFAAYIDWRIDHPSDDLMTELLHAEFDDATGTRRRLSRDEILGYVHLLAGAGNETTTRLIGWMGKVLADHPDQRKQVVDDRALLPNTIEELLRYESPSPVQARYVMHEVEHYGTVVPEGSVMLALTASGNRDERRFPDADRFDIRRKIDHHLAFGYGIHFCMGAALARLEGRIALDEVLHRFPEWDVDSDNAVQARTSTVRGWERLPVVVP
jgi:cytochrome P450